MWSVPCTRVWAGLLLLLLAGLQGSAGQEDASAAGCDCQDLAVQISQLSSNISEQQNVNKQRDDEQSNKLDQLSSLVKDNSATGDQLLDQILSLSGQMGNNSMADSQLKREVQVISFRLQDVVSSNRRLTTQVRNITSQLEQMSDRLDQLETRSPATTEPPPPEERDCSDMPAGFQSGVHLLQPVTAAGGAAVPAFCDLDTHGGGWTVIQRRADVTPRENFYRGWAAYKEGFGELDGEFWWGLENMWALTSTKDRQYELRIDLEDFEGEKKHAIYQNFRISSESDGYRLTVTNYKGNAGDSFSYHSGQRFTTMDKDQDAKRSGNCAKLKQGAWWYKRCSRSNLNGMHLSGQQRRSTKGVHWRSFHGDRYSLKTVTMKVRPTSWQ